MKSRRTDNGYFISIEPGEEIVSTLITFAKKYSVPAGVFTAIGAVSSIELGYYELKEKQYHWKKIEGTIEIASAIGNITWLDGDPIVHLHGVFSGTDLATFGGHVRNTTVSAACEIVLTEQNDRLNRAFDERTGLNLWSC